MPIYQYLCKECGKSFDVLFKSASERKEVLCPNCGSKDVEKSFAAFSVKGGGSAGVGFSEGSCPSCCSGGSCSLS